MPQDGSAPPQQLTTGGDVYKYDLPWSPDGKKIAWTDRKQRLFYLDVDTKTVTRVAHAEAFEISTYAWSPDSQWLAYVKPEIEAPSRIYLYSLEQRKGFPVTDPQYGAGEPAFSADGKYLFFESARDFTPVFGETEFNHVYLDMNHIYLIVLAKDGANPFPPKSDEVGEPKPAGPPTARPDATAEKLAADVKVKVDVEGITERTLALGVPAGNYRQLTAVGGALYYVRNSRREPMPTLAMYDLAAQKETPLGPIGGFEISADGKKMLVSQGPPTAVKYAIIELPKAPVQVGEGLN